MATAEAPAPDAQSEPSERPVRLPFEAGSHTLCTCGASATYPHCDGEPPECDPIERQFDSTRRVRICWDGCSGKKPFCDGSHNKRTMAATRKPLDPDPELWAALNDGIGLTEVLDDFYTRVYADDDLAPFFKQVTKDWVRQKQYAFMSQIITGENVYFGYRPRNAHHWMVISDELFDYREELLADCFHRWGLSEAHIARIREIDECFRKQIVKSAPRPRKFAGKAQPLTGYDRMTLEFGTVCDGCADAIDVGAEASYHVRTGRLYCDPCMTDRRDADLE